MCFCGRSSTQQLVCACLLRGHPEGLQTLLFPQRQGWGGILDTPQSPLHAVLPCLYVVSGGARIEAEEDGVSICVAVGKPSFMLGGAFTAAAGGAPESELSEHMAPQGEVGCVVGALEGEGGLFTSPQGRSSNTQRCSVPSTGS